MVFTEILVSGLMVSAAYCMLSSGLALLVGVGLVTDMCFASYFMIAPYVAVQCMVWIGPKFGLSSGIFLGLIATGILGYLVHKYLISPLRPDNFSIMILTLGIALAVQELLIMLVGTKSVSAPTLGHGAIVIFDVYILKQQLLCAGIAIIVLGLLALLVYKTKHGIAMRAVSENSVAGSISGVDIEKIYVFIGILGAALAGLAGMMITPTAGLSPYTWMTFGLVPWAIITIGGWGKLWPIVPASIIIGFAEVIVAYLLPGGAYLKRSIALGIMLIVVIFRPQGIAGLRGWGAY